MDEKYFQFLTNEVRKHCPLARAFVFGSALYRKKFHDVDLAITGSVDAKSLELLRERLEESNFPYIVDVVAFDTVAADFRTAVQKTPIRWLN